MIILHALGTIGNHTHESQIPVLKPEITKVYWMNYGFISTYGELGDEVEFHIETKDIKDGQSIELKLFDENFFSDTFIDGEEYKVPISGNKGVLKLKLKEEWWSYIDTYMEGSELELYFQCKYKKQEVKSPILKTCEGEVKITVFIELPHSTTKSYIGRKGLAGHTAMAIGEKFFDYVLIMI